MLFKQFGGKAVAVNRTAARRVVEVEGGLFLDGSHSSTFIF